MARDFSPIFPFDVPMKLLIPIETTVKGVTKKTFPDPKDVTTIFWAGFRTFGGTESNVNDVYTIYDTAVIDTWYDPAFKADCQVYDIETGFFWEIISDPEDINRDHQFCQFKIRKVGGKA